MKKVVLATLVVALVLGTIETQPAHAGFFGKTTYRVQFQAQVGVYAVVDGNTLKVRVLPATGDHLAGQMVLKVDGVPVKSIDRPPYNANFDLCQPLPILVGWKNDYQRTWNGEGIMLTDGLPHLIEAYMDTYRPNSKDSSVRGKREANWGAAATATLLLEKQEVNSRSEDEAQVRAELEAKQRAFHDQQRSGSSSAGASAAASASVSTDSNLDRFLLADGSGSTTARASTTAMTRTAVPSGTIQVSLHHRTGTLEGEYDINPNDDAGRYKKTFNVGPDDYLIEHVDLGFQIRCRLNGGQWTDWSTLDQAHSVCKFRF
jgi:hypothetical protein